MLFRIILSRHYAAIGTRNCAVNMISVDLNSWEVSFDSESFVHLDGGDLGTDSHNMKRWPHRIVSLKITCFKWCTFYTVLNVVYSIYL